MVSIPNGMEFYNILKYLAFVSKPFQFPTGWNSTFCYSALLVRYIGFNSQRDGILLVLGKPHSFACLVSIPNGMEFYSTNFAIFLGRKR